MRRELAVAVALAVALAVGAPSTVVASVVDAEAWALLERAREARALSFTGEALWVSAEGAVERSTLVEVHGGDGWLRLDGDHGANAAGDGADEGWLLRLPAPGAPPSAVAGQGKYTAAVAGRDRLLDRSCRVVVVTAHDDVLRERLCLDEATGFVLRREVYDDDGRRVRMAVWTALALGEEGARATSRPRASRARESAGRRAGTLLPVDAAGLDALREADWAVPDILPGGYAPVAAYAVAAPEAVPLQLVYDDGLYQVSLFQQRGRLDPEGLPDGAEPADVGFRAWEWPGALPRRLVWEAQGSTFTLVGDAPPSEFLAIAGALPQPESVGPLQRLRRGLGALWRRVSGWA